MTDERSWDAGTWQGSRDAQLRANLRMTVRERLEAMIALGQVAERLSRTDREEVSREEDEGDSR